MLIFIVSIAVAGLAMALGSLLTANAQGNAIAKAMEGISRQPEASGSINGTLIIGLAFVESIAIYVLVVALILIFVNPYATPFLDAEKAKLDVETTKVEIEKAKLFNLDAEKISEIKKEYALELAKKKSALDTDISKLKAEQKKLFDELMKEEKKK
jgi:F-type H+-transporting ATPase subunit c